MELKYPWMIYVGAAICIIIPLLFHWFKKRYKAGIKVANMEYVKEMPYYKSMMLKYKIYKGIAMAMIIVAIMSTAVLIATPRIRHVLKKKEVKRDIYICMDTSDSVDETNLVTCEVYKKMLDQLDGDRVGITIFNGKAVILVPLTTDYDFVKDALDQLEESIRIAYENDQEASYEAMTYKYAGTLLDEGSSCIGDGLASCVFSFENLEDKERNRVIILSTDNDLYSTMPVLTLTEAAQLCKENGIVVLGLTPEKLINASEFESAMELTGGTNITVDEGSSANKIADLIADTEANEEEVSIVTYENKPLIPVIILLISLTAYFVCCRRVKI